MPVREPTRHLEGRHGTKGQASCASCYRIVPPIPGWMVFDHEVEEAVGDGSPLSHKVSLADIDAKYGDIVSSDSVLKYFKSLSGGSGK